MRERRAAEVPGDGSGANPHGWPAQRRYSGAALRRVVMPLGGIGTGTIGLGGNGRLTDWEIGDAPASGRFPRVAHVVARVETPDATSLVALEGPIDDSAFDGPDGSMAQNHGLPRFREAEFSAAYPFARVDLRDEDLAFDASLEAFNPFVPGDVQASSLPLAVLRYRLTNRSASPVKATVCASIAHPLGGEGSARSVTLHRADGLTSLQYKAAGGRPEEDGTFALSVRAGEDVTWRTAWPEPHFGDDLLEYWDDLHDGRLTDHPDATALVGSLASSVDIEAGGSAEVTFLLSWHLPRRRAWKWVPLAFGDSWTYEDDTHLDNHYATKFADALDVVRKTLPDLERLERRTRSFVEAFCRQDVPTELLEAALSATSVLRSQTVFRTGDGHFYGWEGCAADTGSCHGNCTHVWHYEYATSHLFGELARSMRELEFLHATDESGKMSFRIGLPLETHAREWPYAAADGQTGAVVRLYHDWRLSGDDEWLRRLYPAARRAIEFCWIEGGWDADRDGLMEGVQHNTYDVEFYGPSPQMQGWYLAALAAGAVMAAAVGDDGFAALCAELHESGRRLTESVTFNGDYYQQDVRPLREGDAVAFGLRRRTETDEIGRDPVSQLGAGCLVDQLVGDTAARLAGLRGPFDPEHFRSAAAAVFRNNRRDRADRTLNHMRSFALADEASLVICSFPRGDRPKTPFPYCSEAMPGFEYAAATALVQAGMPGEALRVVSDVRARFDGTRRNPFDEMECGRHYVRSMASWGTLLAWQGLRVDAVEQSIHLAPRSERSDLVWTNGFGWGTASLDGARLRVSVEEGVLTLTAIHVDGVGRWSAQGDTTLAAGDRLEVTLQTEC
ncbi:GH116 family glycosyl-hydrolase [Microbacterium sp. A20]|uniref:GH116 family glycosyl-hydrolase n=2 Tax=unclassified Microbacterium TaxID=2609290 RepID=UPI001443E682|nr:GH116 family glycosyl-hydrolase [Microbacterium sp. A20]